MDGGVLGLGAGSTISGYEIAGIGHGVHMRLVTYPIRLVSGVEEHGRVMRTRAQLVEI